MGIDVNVGKLIGGAAGPGVGAAAGMAAGLVGLVVVLYLLILALGVIMYIFSSMSLYQIARRRGLEAPGLAWVPVMNAWLLGSISDDYDLRVGGQVKNRRTLLLVLNILLVTLPLFLLALTFSGLGDAMFFNQAPTGGQIALIVLLYVGYFGLAVVQAVFGYICYYKLFKSCDPERATVFTVLSILFNVTLPFFLFALRKKDLGMVQARQE